MIQNPDLPHILDLMLKKDNKNSLFLFLWKNFSDSWSKKTLEFPLFNLWIRRKWQWNNWLWRNWLHWWRSSIQRRIGLLYDIFEGGSKSSMSTSWCISTNIRLGERNDFHTIPYRRILKISKERNLHRARFSKNPEQTLHLLIYVSVLLIFVQTIGLKIASQHRKMIFAVIN